jgi:hypothetical protein
MSPAGASPGVQARPALTLAFFAAGFGVLALLLGWACIDPALLLGGYYQPRLLAFAHALVLGWLGSIFIGAAYQLGPVIAAHSLRWAWLGWVHLALHVAGVPAMIHGFSAGDFRFVMAGGTLVSAGFGAFILTQVATASRRWRADAVGCGLVVAWFWLAVTVGLGLHMTWNRILGIEAAPSPWLRIHAMLGVLGFFLTVFNAVSLRLVPMFAVTSEQSPRRVWASLILTQAGLQFVAPACLLPFGFLKWAAAVLILAGQLLFIREIIAQLQQRHRRLDVPLKWFSASFAWLVPALAGFLVLLVPLPAKPAFIDEGSGPVLVFAVFLLGCLTTAILAMSCKIIPFLIWQAAYARYLGRQRTPMLDGLVSRPLLLAALGLTSAGICVLIVVLALQSAAGVRAAILVFLLGVLCVITNSLSAARHLWKPRLQPLKPVSPC